MVTVRQYTSPIDASPILAGWFSLFGLSSKKQDQGGDDATHRRIDTWSKYTPRPRTPIIRNKGLI